MSIDSSRQVMGMTETNRIITGDCLEELNTLPANSVHAPRGFMGKACVVNAMKGPLYRQKDWLRKRYVEEGKTITEIAEELDVDHTTISKWRRKLNIPKRDKQVSLECPVCGSDFERPRSKVDRAKHANVCSRECIYEGRSQGIIGRDVDGGYDVSETVETRECNHCGGSFKTTLSEDYNHCSRECFLSRHSERMAGDGNPAYNDGSSYESRGNHGPHWDKERLRCYEQDDFTCQRCGDKCISRSEYNGENGAKIIQAHHVDKGGGNGLENLVTLCARCHAEVEGGANLNV